MLDIKFIRENTEAVKANLVNRHNDFDLDEVIELDRKLSLIHISEPTRRS